jgi:hypothetical protein
MMSAQQIQQRRHSDAAAFTAQGDIDLWGDNRRLGLLAVLNQRRPGCLGGLG